MKRWCLQNDIIADGYRHLLAPERRRHRGRQRDVVDHHLQLDRLVRHPGRMDRQLG